MYISEKYVKENINVIISVLNAVMMLLMFTLLPKMTRNNIISKRKLNEKYTKKFKDILKDNDVKVYEILNKEPNAFVFEEIPSLNYTTGLVKLLNEKEMVAVLLHEYGHHHGNHISQLNQKNKTTIFSGFILAVITSLLSTFVPLLYVIYLQFLVFLGYIGAEQTKQLPTGRKWEYYSDSFATKKGYGRELISALKKVEEFIRKKICEDSSINPKSQQCSVLMSNLYKNDEHPELKDRIENILKTSKVKSIALSGSLINFKNIKLKILKMFS